MANQRVYRVPLKEVTTTIYNVKAESAYAAMELVLEDPDNKNCELVEFIDGDGEVYYPDIREIGP